MSGMEAFHFANATIVEVVVSMTVRKWALGSVSSSRRLVSHHWVVLGVRGKQTRETSSVSKAER